MRVAATDFVRDFAKYKDEARDEPVEVTNHQRIAGYFISPNDFTEFLALREKSTRTLIVGQLSAQALADIRASEMSEAHTDLNALMD